MPNHSFYDYFYHLDACRDGLIFLQENPADSLGELFQHMNRESDEQLDFVVWALDEAASKIKRSESVGMEVRRLTNLYVRTVYAKIEDAPEEDTNQDTKDTLLGKLQGWIDPEICDTADYVCKCRAALEGVTPWSEGCSAVYSALHELSNEFDRVWNLVMDWIDENDPIETEEEEEEQDGRVVQVLEELGACNESKDYFRAYDDIDEAYEELVNNPGDPQTGWWFWIVQEVCEESGAEGAFRLRCILQDLQELNAETSEDVHVAFEIGKMIGELRATSKMNSTLGRDFYDLHDDFDDVSSVMSAHKKYLIEMWEAFARSKGL